MNQKFVEGEMVGDYEHPAVDHLKNIHWRTAEGRVIAIPDLEDSHLRNISLFLMGMGYRRCIASNEKRTAYLVVLRMEWERRMAERARVAAVKNELARFDTEIEVIE
jgi:hypothetical protein